MSHDTRLSREAFAELYERELPFVRGVLRRTGLKHGWVEDAAQDVLLVAWKAYARFDPTRPLRPWLMGIAARISKDLQRRAYWSREEPELIIERAEERPDAEAALLHEAVRDAVRRAVAALEPDRRSVLVMHELEELHIPDVARALKVPLNTAYSRLRLARRDLREALLGTAGELGLAA